MTQRSVPSRFTDNPFRDPNISPETAAALDRRNAAVRVWHRTGDPSEAAKIGITLPDRRAEYALREMKQKNPQQE